MIAMHMTLEQAARKGKNYLPDSHRYVVPVSRKQAPRGMREHWPKLHRGRASSGLLGTLKHLLGHRKHR